MFKLKNVSTKQLVVFVLVLCFGSLFWTGAILTKIMGTTGMGTYAVSCSTTTATELRPASSGSQRKGISFYNNSSYTVYIGSYAATSTTSLYPVPSKASFSDNIEPYIGAWYGLGTTAACNVRVVEKWGSNY